MATLYSCFLFFLTPALLVSSLSVEIAYHGTVAVAHKAHIRSSQTPRKVSNYSRGVSRIPTLRSHLPHPLENQVLSMMEVSPALADPIAQRSTAIELMICGMLFLTGLTLMLSKPMLACKARPLGPTSNTHQESVRTSQQSAQVIHVFNGLRVLLISGVIMNHFGIFKTVGLDYFQSDWIQHQPMQFFTTLAGFIRVYTSKQTESYDRVATRAYCAKILARFCPAYWVALVWTGMLNHFQKPFLAWPIQALLLQACLPLKMEGAPFGGMFQLAGNWGGWFTSSVVIASCLFPMLWNISHWLETHNKPLRALALLILFLSLRSMLAYVLDVVDNGDNCHYSFCLSSKSIYPRLLEFVVGMLAAQLCARCPPWLSEWRAWGYVLDLTLLSFYAMKYLNGIWPATCRICNVFMWPLLIMSAWASTQTPNSHGMASSGFLARALSSKLFSHIAEYSFGAYIYQFAVLYTIEQHILIKWRFSNVLSFFASWAVAVTSESLLEKRVREMIDDRGKV